MVGADWFGDSRRLPGRGVVRLGLPGPALWLLCPVLADDSQDPVGFLDEGGEAGSEEAEHGPAALLEQGFGRIPGFWWDAGAVALVDVAADHATEYRMWLAISVGHAYRPFSKWKVTNEGQPVTDFMTPSDFASKVDWEGGIHGALEYGLKSTHLDPDDPDSTELRAAWVALEEAYRPFAAQEDVVGGLIEGLLEGED